MCQDCHSLCSGSSHLWPFTIPLAGSLVRSKASVRSRMAVPPMASMARWSMERWSVGVHRWLDGAMVDGAMVGGAMADGAMVDGAMERWPVLMARWGDGRWSDGRRSNGRGSDGRWSDGLRGLRRPRWNGRGGAHDVRWSIVHGAMAVLGDGWDDSFESDGSDSGHMDTTEGLSDGCDDGFEPDGSDSGHVDSAERLDSGRWSMVDGRWRALACSGR